MKKLFFTLSIFILPGISHAQSKADYEAAMDKFAKYYNQKRMNKLRKLFACDSDLTHGQKWEIDSFCKDWGKIKDFKVTQLCDGRVRFFTTFANSNGLIQSETSFSLNKENKIVNFNLIGGHCGGSFSTNGLQYR